jgi:hypothetical protein
VTKDMKYTVFVGGFEVNDYLLNRDQAESLAQEYKNDGYDDVEIQEVAENE